ncbi:MAG: hypothetical protein L6R41_002611 [Letrouitia leprolyta]|nr:MAG: hypothetical protein L6R41_002611 [Letrouitia leprolyta]
MSDFADERFEDSDMDTDDQSSNADTLFDDGERAESEVGSEEQDNDGEFSPRYIDLQAQNMDWDQFSQIVHSNFQRNAPACLRLAQQVNLIDRILEFAMLANDNIIVMPRSTGSTANTGISTEALAINHRLYHVCRRVLYRDNDFIVDGNGSGVQYLGQDMGFNTCGSTCSRQPVIKSLCLVLGSPNHDEEGFDMCESFTQALNDMANGITVEHLRIDLQAFCFLNNEDLVSFAIALGNKIKVNRDVDVHGLDVHWELNLCALPLALEMRSQPIQCDFKIHNDRLQQVGPFNCMYQRAQNVNERFGVDLNGKKLVVVDGKYFYKLAEDGVYEETEVLGGRLTHFRQGNDVNYYLFREH